MHPINYLPQLSSLSKPTCTDHLLGSPPPHLFNGMCSRTKRLAMTRKNVATTWATTLLHRCASQLESTPTTAALPPNLYIYHSLLTLLSPNLHWPSDHITTSCSCRRSPPSHFHLASQASVSHRQSTSLCHGWAPPSNLRATVAQGLWNNITETRPQVLYN